MPKRILALLTVVIVAFAAFIAVGCGSDDSGDGGSGKTVQVDMQKTLDATKAKGSAAFMAKLSIKDDKETIGLGIVGKGDFENNKWDLKFDAAKLLQSAGVAGSGEGNVQVLVDGKKIWINMPALQGMQLPGNAKWISLDLSKLPSQDTPEKGKAPTFEMTEVGSETVDGVSVRHLKSETTLRKLLDSVPAAQRKQLDSQINKNKDANEALDQKLPFELWLDNDDVLYRLKTGLSVEQDSLAIDIQLSDFGSEVTITPPPASETFDGTQMLEGFAGQLGTGATP